jgi:pantoate--beta-alanine ligase
MAGSREALLVARTIDEARAAIDKARTAGRSIGLVPTMGALHAGHLSLLHAARSETGYVVASIFVNPTQFGPREDFSRYPRPFEADLAVCREARTDMVFAPEAREIYPENFRTFVEVRELGDVLCGASRPGHFRGVATVVLKLFEIVRPDVAYFGQKDAQQCRVIEQMVRDLDVSVRLRICPIVREADGLAMSSRNQYLTPEERSRAPVLYQALEEARKLIENGESDASRVRQLMATRITATPGAVLDYAAVVDADTLLPLPEVPARALLALAVKFGQARLIDNVKVSPRQLPSPPGGGEGRG